MSNSLVNNNREAFEAWYIKEYGFIWEDEGVHYSLVKDECGWYISPHTQQNWKSWQAALAQANEVKHECNEKSQAQQPTDLSKQLREYAADSGYSHNDYADTMLAAASEIERYYGGMMAWKKTAEAKDRKLSQEIENRISERCAARLVASQSQQYHSEDALNMVQSQAQQEPVKTENKNTSNFRVCLRRAYLSTRLEPCLIRYSAMQDEAEKSPDFIRWLTDKIVYELPPAPVSDNEQPMNEVNKPEGGDK